ncbi:hypothetical protein FB567DRAFT_554068 [Paraphoma chrysanthemicola]|uniref:Uncharacterized protein n=1 Tax=Paraphoma chrysanthemicola TaxID=798071 RepID=A0A8K0VSZ3_9PLEO|nr:hypothetical protein FB567DRAFT_554068 [Paraphoma chrysanthemicola]
MAECFDACDGFEEPGKPGDNRKKDSAPSPALCNKSDTFSLMRGKEDLSASTPQNELEMSRTQWRMIIEAALVPRQYAARSRKGGCGPARCALLSELPPSRSKASRVIFLLKAIELWLAVSIVCLILAFQSRSGSGSYVLASICEYNSFAAFGTSDLGYVQKTAPVVTPVASLASGVGYRWAHRVYGMACHHRGSRPLRMPAPACVCPTLLSNELRGVDSIRDLAES